MRGFVLSTKLNIQRHKWAPIQFSPFKALCVRALSFCARITTAATSDDDDDDAKCDKKKNYIEYYANDKIELLSTGTRESFLRNSGGRFAYDANKLGDFRNIYIIKFTV